jgi:hypothetical protein
MQPNTDKQNECGKLGSAADQKDRDAQEQADIIAEIEEAENVIVGEMALAIAAIARQIAALESHASVGEKMTKIV